MVGSCTLGTLLRCSICTVLLGVQQEDLSSEKTLTHPIVFSLGVEPVIHSLNNTVPAKKKKKHTLILIQVALFSISVSVVDFMKTIYVTKGIVLRRLPKIKAGKKTNKMQGV